MVDDHALDPGLQGRTRGGDRRDIRCRTAARRRAGPVLGTGQGHVLRPDPVLGLGARPDRPGGRDGRRGARPGGHPMSANAAGSGSANGIKVGVLPWGQNVDWPTLRAVGQRADELGYDSLWTWDHLYPIQGDWQRPIFEGYLILAGWAAVTSRATL